GRMATRRARREGACSTRSRPSRTGRSGGRCARPEDGFAPRVVRATCAPRDEPRLVPPEPQLLAFAHGTRRPCRAGRGLQVHEGALLPPRGGGGSPARRPRGAPGGGGRRDGSAEPASRGGGRSRCRCPPPCG